MVAEASTVAVMLSIYASLSSHTSNNLNNLDKQTDILEKNLDSGFAF